MGMDPWHTDTDLLLQYTTAIGVVQPCHLVSAHLVESPEEPNRATMDLARLHGAEQKGPRDLPQPNLFCQLGQSRFLSLP